jgi:hypothetical protein
MAIFEYPMPADVNGEQLKNELKAESVYQIENTLYIVGDLSKETIDKALAAHMPTEPTVTEKLASVGLSIDDLKAALGL